MTDALPASTTVAVIGAGTMGAGVAQVAAAAGHPVLLFDVLEGAAAKGLERTAEGLKKLVERGRISEVERLALVERIRPVDTLSELASASLIIEAIVEDLQVKQNVFLELEALCADNCIFASNTSSISITAIASVLNNPRRLVGMHFFNPAPVMKLVEVVSGLATSSEVSACIHATATAWEKQAVYAKSTPGFIVNRVARPFYAEGLRLLQEQAGDAATIDAIMREAGGFRMGPFELTDLIGHDVNFAVTQSVFRAYHNDPRFTPSLIQQELVSAGRLGRKSGRGFYDYSPNAVKPVPLSITPKSRIDQIRVYGDMGAAEPLLELWQQAGIDIRREAVESNVWQGVVEVKGSQLALTDGRTATLRAAQDGFDNLVLFDLALNYSEAGRIAIAVSLQADEQALATVADLFSMINKQTSPLTDVPGLAVMRTVAMLVNEAADAVNQGVCSVADVDTAMCAGVNYPRGPLAWADRLGPHLVQRILNHLADFYGEDRYRCSPLIRQKVAAGLTFYPD